MNSKTTAIVASVLIIALASSAIIGVTYSWFSDEDKVGISFTPGKVDIDTSVSEMKVNGISDEDGDNFIKDYTTEVKLTDNGNKCEIDFNNVKPGDVLEFKLTITNNSTIKAKWAVTAGNYNSEIYDIKISCGDIDCSKYAKSSINPVAQWNGLVFGDYHLFAVQLLSIVITIAWAVVGACICIGIVRLFTPLRASEKEELLGMDATQHGESAYPSFNGFD